MIMAVIGKVRLGTRTGIVGTGTGPSPVISGPNDWSRCLNVLVFVTKSLLALWGTGSDLCRSSCNIAGRKIKP